MGLGFLLPLSAIVTTVILVGITDARPGTKVAAIVVCLGTFLVPRLFPSIWWLSGPLQAGLSISIILYLKIRGFVD